MSKYRFEMHFHTSETSPCGSIAAAEGVRCYHEQGYSGIVVTDHLIATVEGGSGEISWKTAVDRFLAGYRAAKAAGDACGMAVYLGAEIRFPNDHDNDYLIYGLTEEFLYQHEWLYEKDLPACFRLAEESGLLVVQAHPFRSWCVPADPAYLHGAEVYNGNLRHDSHNGRAAAFAKQHALLSTVGSDFHEYEDLARAAVCFVSMPQSGEELVRLLREGRYSLQTAED